MILSDRSIKNLIDDGTIGAYNSDGSNMYIGPSSLDLHLDNKALILDLDKKDAINVKDPEINKRFKNYSGWDEITINPGEFYILHTKERLSFPRDIAGFIQGRSSLARLGINIHAAGFFDPGFSGTATLEVTNFTSVPITIPANTRIAQMVFVKLDQPVEVDYSQKSDRKYMGQNDPTLTKIYKDYEEN